MSILIIVFPIIAIDNSFQKYFFLHISTVTLAFLKSILFRVEQERLLQKKKNIKWW